MCVYNQGYKALSLLITILARVVMNRLLTRDALGLGSVCVYVCVLPNPRASRVSNRNITTLASMVIGRLTALQPWL